MTTAALLISILTQAPVSLEANDINTDSAVGLSYLCQSGAVQRKVEVIYPQGTQVPCQVQYQKDGAKQVLWQAQNQVGYCEAKATGFAQKLSSMGWQCHQE